MTRIISFNELRFVNSLDNAVYFSKDIFSKSDLLIAQDEVKEEWFDVQEQLVELPLKTGYTMYILTKHIK